MRRRHQVAAVGWWTSELGGLVDWWGGLVGGWWPRKPRLLGGWLSSLGMYSISCSGFLHVTVIIIIMY